MKPGTKSRVQILKEMVGTAEKSKPDGTSDVPFRDQRHPFPRIRVRLDFPLYRIQSGRTRRAQSQYLEWHPDLPKDFFADPEDRAVQRAQGEILLRMTHEAKLAEDLELKGQYSPIVLTYDGFVVDGNRRLAALREQKKEYASAVVLPSDATSSEIYETELELQMARETKAKYDWVDELLNIRHGLVSQHESLDTIARIMRLDKKDLEKSLEILTMVDMYLNWLEAPGQYHRIPGDVSGGAKQAFIELTEGLEKKNVKPLGQGAKSTIREACFAASMEVEGYIMIRSIIKQMSGKPDLMLERLKEDSDVSSHLQSETKKRAAEKASEQNEGGEDPLRVLAEEDAEETPAVFGELGILFAEPGSAERFSTPMILVVRELAEEESEANKKRVPLMNVKRAEGNLKKVHVTSETKSLDEIARALGRVNKQIDRLTKELEKAKGD